MGSEQQFCLRWNNFQTSLLETLPQLLDRDDLTDVTLAAQGRTLRAHRVVLSASSGFFKDVFRELGTLQHPVVVVPGATFADLCALVTFMYSGEVNISQDQLPGLLSTADALMVRGLTDVPRSKSVNKAPSSKWPVNAEQSSRDKQHILPAAKKPKLGTSHATQSPPRNEPASTRSALQAEKVQPSKEPMPPCIVKVEEDQLLENHEEASGFESVGLPEAVDGEDCYGTASCSASRDVFKQSPFSVKEDSVAPCSNEKDMVAVNGNGKQGQPTSDDSAGSGSDVDKLNFPTGLPMRARTFVTCFVCGKHLSNQYNLKVHLETHQNMNYSCLLCNHVSRSRDALRKHIAYKHADDKERFVGRKYGLVPQTTDRGIVRT